MDAHRHARDIEGVDLRLREEVAAVDEREADGLALLLVCLRAFEDEERVVDMAGLAAQAADGLDTRAQVRDALPALAAPPARELHEVVVRIGKVNGEAHRARERHSLAALVDEIVIARSVTSSVSASSSSSTYVAGRPCSFGLPATISCET